MKGNQNIFNTADQIAQRIALLENQMRNLNTGLGAFFLKGRLRSDRTAPTSSADVQTPDLLYDWVLKDDYVYIVIDDAGALAWRRITAAAF
jgi:hypothetical protein